MRKPFPEPVIVRGRRWFRSPLGWLWILAVILGAGLVVYGLGRAGIGPGVPGVLASLGGLRDELRDRDATISELRRQLADYDTSKTAQEEERRELARTIGELQAEVARQKQQLEFYRGIVIKGSERIDVAIRELRVAPGASSGRYVVRLSLEHPGKSQGAVTGVAKFTVDGLQAGRAAQVVGPETAYNFRYFSALQPELMLPVGFTPQRLTVELRAPDRPEVLVTRTMVWAVDGG